MLRKKIKKMIDKGYIAPSTRRIQSLIKYFAVPKGVLEGVVQDWRIVFHAGAADEHAKEDGEYAYQHNDAMDEETMGREEESIPAFEFADDLDGLVYGLECEVLVPPMRGQHIALEMLRETTETVV